MGMVRESVDVTADAEIEIRHSDEGVEGIETTSEDADVPADAGPEDAGASGERIIYLKPLLGLLLVGVVVVVIIDSFRGRYALDAVEEFLEWVEDNPYEGVVLFVIVYLVLTVMVVPGSVLTLGAGFVFAAAFGTGGGIVVGIVAVFLGASLGATVAFFLGRFLLRDQALKLTQRFAFFEALDAVLSENGLKIFVLLRLSPVVPFSALNYIGGVTSVPFRDYALALFAILPGTTLYVSLGASAGSLAESANKGSGEAVTFVVLGVGLLFGFLAIGLIAKYARRELNRVIEGRRTDNEETDATAEYGSL